ncbi:hypothetical protein MATR_33560 [Marivirga tractuosa]|uniref:Uncharacterized protein n=1 Tax=Marivirga tractuosa (strain ATCC 23168 / DSM 4126 / NBRC 15989 / NCIMB 1408 / VKM B-1430 / H-43) TaxID=643867 RepID=E4TRU9_MARTH|nr:nucleotidyltransferase [Marivirga tractuosa]ADR22798.1 hypothetical protein Ftrac_2820 [Marivirga tractuosa DSM 4126]BDD16531.1 hypothetical protein MATR_33560 [Marivirga tractuosa]
MLNIFNADFKEYIQTLNKYKVSYLLVGGLAVNVYGYRRSTGDMDVFVKADSENHKRMRKVHSEFGMHMGEMEVEEFFVDNDRYDVFTFGVSPVQIDIMTKCKGLKFDEAFDASKIVNIEGVDVRVVSKHDLIVAKQASDRTRDRADIEELKKLKDNL